MGQKDPQATSVERVRWADALGMLPPDSRPSKLDRSAARLSALHDELLDLQRDKTAGADDKESAALTENFVQTLKTWNENLIDIAGRLEKDPKTQGGDAASITTDLRKTADIMAAGISQAAQKKQPEAAAADIPWAKAGEGIDRVLTKLIPLSDQSDAEYLSQHASDPLVQDAMSKIGQMRRADIAYGALVGKSRDLPSSMADVFDRQNTKIITFAGGQQIIALPSKTEIPKAIKAGLEPIGTSTNITDALKFVSEQVAQNERASVLIVSDGRVNDGGDPTEAAQRLGDRGVRVFSLGLGSRQVAPTPRLNSLTRRTGSTRTTRSSLRLCFALTDWPVNRSRSTFFAARPSSIRRRSRPLRARPRR